MKHRLTVRTLTLLTILLSMISVVSADDFNASDVTVHSISSNSAIVSWLTNEPADGRVNYGTSSETLPLRARHSTLLTNHSMILSGGIEPNTQYFFEIISENAQGEEVLLRDEGDEPFSFTTTDPTPPAQVQNLRASVIQDTSVTLTWDQNTDGDFSHYIVTRDGVDVAQSTFALFTDTGLTPETTFRYRVRAVDQSGNEGGSSNAVTITTTATGEQPTTTQEPSLPNSRTSNGTSIFIHSFAIGDITPTGATVFWKTNTLGTSRIVYQTGNDITTARSDVRATVHSFVLENLTDRALYSITAETCDGSDCATHFANLTAGVDNDHAGLSVALPRFTNRRSINIVGSTEPFSDVTLFVNNLNFPTRFLSADQTGKFGTIQFRNIPLQNKNIIKIESVDKAKNKETKTFEIDVDTSLPLLTLQDLISPTRLRNGTLSGQVNEPVELSVFITKADLVPIEQRNITDFVANNVGQNHVSLLWDKISDRDFSHYIIHREDVGPIAILKSEDENRFLDTSVDSGVEYSYAISYLNRFGSESPKTPLVTVKTPRGGIFTGLKPSPINTAGDFSEPFTTFNSSGAFSVELQLGAIDGQYNVKVQAIDRAGNIVQREKSVVLDTSIPTLDVTSPPNGALLFENFADEVDIRGRTEPNAQVLLFVGRTPIVNANLGTQVSGFPNSLEDIPESELVGDCTAIFNKAQVCATRADVVVKSDANGFFEFENIDLTGLLSAVGDVREVSIEDFNDNLPDQDRNAISPREQNAKLFVMVIDEVGHRTSTELTVRIGNCFSGSFDWDIIPLTEFQSPSFLSTERLAEGTEHIYFYFNYTYFGDGVEPTINRISMTKACGDSELLDSRFNLSCRILPNGDQPTPVSPDGTLSYSAIRLSPIRDMDRWLRADWDSFLTAVNSELSFPFKVTIQYTHTVDGVEVIETQSMCQEVTYVMDNTRIDFNSTLPDWLLYDAVEFLNESLGAIREMQEQVSLVVEQIAPVCLASYAGHYGTKVWRNFEESTVRAKLRLKPITEGASELLGLDLNGFELPSEHSEYCTNLIKAFGSSEEYGDFDIDYLSDADLATCFPSVHQAWEAESDSYQAYRYVCDRLFGHKTPSRWTEDRTDDELYQRIKAGEENECSLDGSTRGQPIRRVKCELLAEEEGGFIGQEAKKLKGEDCAVIYYGDQKTLYTFQKSGGRVAGSDDLFRMERKFGSDATTKTEYAIKITDDTYITSYKQSCAERCGIDLTKEVKKGVVLGGNKEGSNKGASQTETSADGKTDKVIAAYCMTPQQCRAARTDSGIVLDGVPITNAEANPVGFTYKITGDEKSNQAGGSCFYDHTKSANVVSKDANKREECCCINAKAQEETAYYNAQDTYRSELVNQLAKEEFVHVATETAEQVSSSILTTADLDSSNGQIDQKIDWSYRYSRIGFQAQDSTNPQKANVEYNPYRYYKERDEPACFGQNSVAHEFWNKEQLLMIDPAKQWTSMLQCANIGGVNNRLQLIANGVTQLQNCLIMIRTKGTADSGVCKEIFTQYVCSLAWDLISKAVDNRECSALPEDIRQQIETDDDIAQTLKGGLTSLYKSVEQLQSEVNDEYSNSQLRQFLGENGEAVARKVCLGAFGYDWELSAEGLIDAAYAQPFATLVLPATSSREFLTVDPVKGTPTYEYRSSWIVNPGCPLSSYRVKLACIDRDTLNSGKGADCTEQDSPDGINCPCLDTGQEEFSGYFSTANSMGQNEMQNEDAHKVVTQPFRFDHLKFELRTSPKVDKDLRDSCFPDGYEDGVFYHPITDRTVTQQLLCRIETRTGSLDCGSAVSFFAAKGTATFQELLINNEPATRFEEALSSRPLSVSGTVFNSGGPKCARFVLGRGTSIQNNDLIRVQPITGTGVVPLPTLTLTNSLSTGTTDATSSISAPLQFRVKRGDLQSNTEQLSFSLIVTDNGNRRFSILEDTVQLIFEDEIGDESGSTFTILENSELIELPENVGISVLVGDATGDLIIQQAGGSFHLEDVDFSSSGIVSGTVIVPPARGTGQSTNQIIGDTVSSQNKVLQVGLFHTKGGVDTIVNPLEDCNFNDPVRSNGVRQVTDFRFRVVALGSNDRTNVNNPIITVLDSPREALSPTNTPSQVVARISDVTGISSTKLQLNHKETNDVLEFSGEDGLREVGIETFQKLINYDDFAGKSAGSYLISLSATDNDPGQQNTRVEEITRPLFVACADVDPDANKFGVCRPENGCSQEDTESFPNLACPTGQVCCKK